MRLPPQRAEVCRESDCVRLSHYSISPSIMCGYGTVKCRDGAVFTRKAYGSTTSDIFAYACRTGMCEEHGGVVGCSGYPVYFGPWSDRCAQF